MSFPAWLSLGFLGMASTGFAGSRQVPLGAHDGAVDIHALTAAPRASSAPAAITIPNFKPSEFPFVTTVPDDGEGKGGGWQVAKVNLEFVRVVIPTDVKVWHCPFKIEMPLRTEFMGIIDAKRAASLSAGIANTVAIGMDYKLPQGIFCDTFIDGMKSTFPSTYPKLGARITK